MFHLQSVSYLAFLGFLPVGLLNVQGSGGNRCHRPKYVGCRMADHSATRQMAVRSSTVDKDITGKNKLDIDTVLVGRLRHHSALTAHRR